MIARAIRPRGTPTPAPMAVLRLLPPLAVADDVGVVVVVGICVFGSGALVTIPVLDVTDGWLDVVDNVVG